jgi:hypothetical protein
MEPRLSVAVLYLKVATIAQTVGVVQRNLTTLSAMPSFVHVKRLYRYGLAAIFTLAVRSLPYLKTYLLYGLAAVHFADCSNGHGQVRSLGRKKSLLVRKDSARKAVLP